MSITQYIVTNIFGHNPMKPIQSHMVKVFECSGLLPDFFKKVYAKDWLAAEQCRQQIIDKEHEADVMKKNMRLALPKSVFLPVPRSDLLEIITIQDKIANIARDISGIVIGRKMEIPDAIQEYFMQFTQIAVATIEQASQAISTLESLLESGFSNEEKAVTDERIKALNDVESQADKKQIEIRAQLFKLEKTLPAVDVLFLYKIIDWIAELSDLATRVGSHLQLLLAS